MNLSLPSLYLTIFIYIKLQNPPIKPIDLHLKVTNKKGNMEENALINYVNMEENTLMNLNKNYNSKRKNDI